MNYKNHFIIFAFAFVLTFYSNAQINKGTWMVGGNLSGRVTNSQSSDTNNTYINKTTSFSILPQIGYFISKNILLGASLGYDYFNGNYENDYTRNSMHYYSNTSIQKSTSQSMKFGVLAGYYAPINDRIYFNSYFTMDYSIPFYSYNQSTSSTINNSPFVTTNNSSNSSTTDNTKKTSGTFNLGISPGLSFFVTSKLALEASLGILNYSTNFTNDSSAKKSNSSGSGFNFGINSISLGIRYFIPKKA